MLYTKYRVFREPEEETIDGHPVRAVASYFVEYQGPDGEVWAPLEEVEEFVFVLKPDNDHHAQVAVAAYAASCRLESPQLSNDLTEMLGMFLTDEDDSFDPTGLFGSGLRMIKGDGCDSTEPS